MKRCLLILLLLINVGLASAFSSDGCCSCRSTSNSFIYIRPPFQISSPERLAHFRDDRVEKRDDGWFGAFQIVPFGGKAVNTENLSTFWGPSCNRTLTVNEDITASGTDILANHLNIYTLAGNFQSKVSFNFDHAYAGVGFYYQQEIYHTHTGRALWVSIAVPVEHVSNRININEVILNNGGGVLPGPVSDTPLTFGCDQCATCLDSSTLPIPRPSSVTAAFAQPGWCFGKINSCRSMSKTAVADVELRGALQIANNEHSHMESWAGVTIPTGNADDGRYVFEPVVGYNKHFIAFVGSTFGVHVYENEADTLRVYSEFDFNVQYFFAHNEVRAADIQNIPWSRYMQFYNSETQAGLAFDATDASVKATLQTPGINLMTQVFEVKPGFARTFNVAWDILWRCFEVEAGYNFYCKQAECVKFAQPFPSDIALKVIGGEMIGGAGETNAFQFINAMPNPLFCFDSFTAYEDSVVSASQVQLPALPAALTHTLYLSVAYDTNCGDYPLFVSLGGSYEFPPDNTSMNRWMIFGKFGMSF